MIPQIVLSTIPKILSTIDKSVQDKDLAAQLQQRTVEATLQLMEKAVQTETVPWVDALAKLIVVTVTAFKGLMRPLLGAAMTGAAIYMQVKGIQAPDWLDAVLAAAFPAWMASRHAEKVRKINAQKTSAVEWSDLD